MRSWIPLLSMALCAGPAAHADDWQQTYPGTSGGTVRVKTNDASVTVEGWDEARIEARVHTVGIGIGSGQVRVTDRKLEGGLDLEVWIPPNRSFFNFDRREVEIRLRVPRQVTLTLRSEDGSVRADDLAGKLDIETADGSINGRHLSGDVRLRTADGSIRVNGVEGNLLAQTADGSVALAGRFDRLTATTQDGSIRADADAGSKLGAPWTLRTADGSIHLAVPPDLAARVEAHTNDGSVSSGFEEIHVADGRSSMRGTLNGGGPLLTLETQDGSIRLSRR